ncbi:hypothetical protein DRO97_06900 [Archaeoglobales archaeon]|nr:MAG: hypothetical protein DRO97_06900 [Archaeoglobales archaeon]
MYFEVWVELAKKDEVEKRLRKACKEVYEVFYDYQYIVRVDDENVLNIEGIKKYRRHYNC